MIPRNPHVGTNSTTLDASFGDPATIALSGDIRVATFLEALRRPWWSEAACRDVGVEDFYATSRAAIDRSMQLCGRCVSLMPCRAEAIADPRLDHGIRGGMDVAARKNSRRNAHRSITHEENR